MINTVLFFLHYMLLLLTGILLSFSFAGLSFSRKNCTCIGILFLSCGTLQFIIYLLCGEGTAWQIYPFITHIPIILILCTCFHLHVITAIAAVCSAYMCCQPSKWFGLLCETITGDPIAGQIVRLVSMIVVCIIVVLYLSEYLSRIYRKDARSALTFGILPIIYYLFDYSMGVYTNLWDTFNLTAIEFLPFLLSVVHLVFCVIYYKENESRTDAEAKEQIILLTVEEQAKELESLQQSALEIKILRHDMRLLLSNLLMSIENDDKETSRKLITSYIDSIEATALQQYCSNTTINYILSSFAGRCEHADTEFICQVHMDELYCDEVMLSTILSNALENALNAQKALPHGERKITLLLKSVDRKLLLSVKNPYKESPFFVDGMPVTQQKGHGYGTQSIRYLTERMGGNCQFTTEDHIFVLRVVI